MKHIMVAMSGGVDSSVCAHLLLQSNISLCGATLMLTDMPTSDARAAADRLGISFYAFDEREAFKKYVIADFIAAYERGETPNPCIVCNEKIKFGLLLERALSMGCGGIATGHYAKLSYDAGSGRTLLLRAKDRAKDQTYMLYRLSQEQLSRSVFPLGDLTKAEIREIATEIGLPNAQKPDSQDICFVPDGDYAAVLELLRGAPYPEGDFVDAEGNMLGRHKGIVRYTVGQRKGLGIALGTPAFVLSKNAENNQVVLGDEDGLFSKRIFARDVNWIATNEIADGTEVTVKIRYSQKESRAKLYKTENGVVAEFFEAQRAAAPGQSMVFYDGDVVVGGGYITKGGDGK